MRVRGKTNGKKCKKMGSEEEIDRISEKLVNEIEMFPFLILMI